MHLSGLICFLFFSLFESSSSCIVTANPGLNIRKLPALNATIVGSFYQGTTVKCPTKENGFCHVDTNEWASAEYINCATNRSDSYETTPPKSNYTRLIWRGVKLNQRTVEMLLRAEVYLDEMGMKNFELSFSQGSYSTDVPASAGTHAGGGAVDVRTSVVNNDKKKVDTMVVALRKAGFAAWSRGRVPDGFQNNKHIHAIAFYDQEASPPAKDQMGDFKRGRNGLANDAVDPDAYLGRATPAWAQ